MVANGVKREKFDEQHNMDKEQRRSRSRSPINNKAKNQGRDSSQSRGNRTRNRSRSPRGKRTRAPTNRRVYVANIPYDCKWTTVKDLFREKVGDVSYVELFEDENGKFRGCGIVELKEASAVQKAVDDLHRFEFRGRQLVVKEDFDVDRDKTGKPLGRSSRQSGGGGGGGGGVDRGHSNNSGNYGGNNNNNNNSSLTQYNTYGLSPQFLDSLGISGPLTNRIFVANLDYKVTTQKLEEVFKLAGKILHIDLKRDDDGNSKGHGTIEMSHPVEAVQAISMFSGQKFFNRIMSVRMDKKHKDESDDKRLPEGLQSVGKGLGANGYPLHLSGAAAAAVNSMPSSANMNHLSGLSGVGTGTLGLMQSSLNAGVSSGAGGIPGLSGIGMGLGIGGSADRNVAGGLSGLGQNLGLSNSGNLSSQSLIAGGFGSLTGNSGGLAGSLGSGLGSSLASQLGGSGLSVGGSGVAGGNLRGYTDYGRAFDRDDYSRSSHTVDTIVVRNLPASCSWQNLRDRFREIGDIRFTEMKGRGTAVIRYLNERDAQRAVDVMRGARIDGRPVDVSLF